MSVATAGSKRANRLQATRRNNEMVTAYWEDLFRAPEDGRLVCWYEGIQMNPILQAADIAWCHGEAMSALLAARNQEGLRRAGGPDALITAGDLTDEAVRRRVVERTLREAPPRPQVVPISALIADGVSCSWSRRPKRAA